MGSFVSMVNDSGGSLFEIASYERRSAGSLYADYAYGKRIGQKVNVYTKELNTQVNGFWRLELGAPPSDKDSKIALEVVGSEGRKKKDVTVTYPRVLPATKQRLFMNKHLRVVAFGNWCNTDPFHQIRLGAGSGVQRLPISPIIGI